MLFNSLEFALFLPVVLGVYWFLRTRRTRVVWLLLASATFYACFVVKYLLILLGVIVVDYIAGIAIAGLSGAQRKLALFVSIVANLGVLIVFKYFDFLASSLNALLSFVHAPGLLPGLALLLPIGLSFHVFQSLSYTIEVYRGAQAPERDPLIYALYVMYFPQLVAGPIERPQNLLPQLHRMSTTDADGLSSGLWLITVGLIKKCVVADNANLIVDRVYSKPHAYGGLALWFATFLFAVQIYCDFSGYSSIARGCSRLFGVELMRNFDTPYRARSLQEFWRRWHVSLSTWFRDYVYMPLGGNRSGALRNILLVFVLSGLWHGASWTFVLWGAWHGVGLVAERLLSKRYAGSLSFTFVFVVLGWVLFRANSLADASYIYTHLFSDMLRGLDALPSAILIEALALSAALFALEALDARFDLGRWLEQRAPVQRVAGYGLMMLALMVAGQFSRTQFIYFQF